MQSYSKAEISSDTSIDLLSIITGSLPEDEPLLKELGIDLNRIKEESLIVFSSINSSEANLAEKSHDVIGPAIYLILYTMVLTFTGKILHSYIYLLSTTSIFSYYFFLNVLSPEIHIHLSFCVNTIGYCFLPVLIFLVLRILLFFISKKILLLLGILSAGYSAYKCSILLCYKLKKFDKRFLISYPLFLVYFSYILIALA